MFCLVQNVGELVLHFVVSFYLAGSRSLALHLSSVVTRFPFQIEINMAFHIFIARQSFIVSDSMPTKECMGKYPVQASVGPNLIIV